MKDFQVAVIDSGFGGLTVLSELIGAYPQNNYIYFGDNGHAPYGDRSTEDLARLVEDVIGFVQKKPLDALVLACHTSSTTLGSYFEGKYPFPVMPMVPASLEGILAEKAAFSRGGVDVGIMATRGAIRSHVYKKRLLEEVPGLRVSELACPNLVPAIEKADLSAEAMQALVDEELSSWREKEPAVVLLGCTHYPLVRKEVQASLGSKTILVNPARGIAKGLDALLKEKTPVEREKSPLPCRFLYTSGSKEHFQRFAKRILPEEEGRALSLFEAVH